MKRWSQLIALGFFAVSLAVIPPLACPQNWDAADRKRDAMFEQHRMLDIGGIKPGMVVGEIGAGDGYLTFHLASRVGPGGKVYANDIVETKALEVIRTRAKDKGLANIETILGSEGDPRFPKASLEMVFCLNAFHEIRKPVEFLGNLLASLKPGAKVVIHEWEAEKSISPPPGGERRYTRQEFLDIVAMSPFVLDRIDTSLPGPRAAVYVLSVKQEKTL
jgi:ubiquinone/menaquinone biosynthesis C-methylase UbiE